MHCVNLAHAKCLISLKHGANRQTQPAATCDDALLGSAIGWLLEASDKYKVKLSSKDPSKWASYVYKEAVEQPLNFKQTQYLAITIVKVIRQGRG